MYGVIVYRHGALLRRVAAGQLILLDDRGAMVDSRSCRGEKLISLDDEVCFPCHLAWVVTLLDSVHGVDLRNGEGRCGGTGVTGFNRLLTSASPHSPSTAPRSSTLLDLPQCKGELWLTSIGCGSPFRPDLDGEKGSEDGGDHWRGCADACPPPLDQLVVPDGKLAQRVSHGGGRGDG